ncbi:MAG TPA: hypothetical protein VK996_09300 [Ramlibacter sp.]|nr:hypothetical protein [Ramlibacter sp.]
MASIEQSPVTATPKLPPGAQLPVQWNDDDDLALGCECANPALQIERWGQEEASPVRKS